MSKFILPQGPKDKSRGVPSLKGRPPRSYPQPAHSHSLTPWQGPSKAEAGTLLWLTAAGMLGRGAGCRGRQGPKSLGLRGLERRAKVPPLYILSDKEPWE